jgi:nucleoside triphosphate diphosphatase
MLDAPLQPPCDEQTLDPRRAEAAQGLTQLHGVMAALRTPVTGCPWDLEQSFASIAPYTLEEAYEVADAIARNDMAELKAELGDLLLQVVYHSRMAEEIGAFHLADVVAGITAKMIRRHPHVFGDGEVADAQAQTHAWESIKAAERNAASALEGIATALPALQRAQKLQARAARVGFDWPSIDGVLAKIREETEEVAAELAGPHDRREDEIGDLLFAVVNLARHAAVDADAALRRANAKFERRFRAVEADGQGDMASQTIDQLEERWQAAKRRLG